MLAATSVQDMRSAYRANVCGRLSRGRLACEELLLRFPDERHIEVAPGAHNVQASYRVAFVPGLLNDCFHGAFHPFTDVIAALRESGFSVHDFAASGRATLRENAQGLARQIGELETDLRPLIVVVHSKGLADVLELIVEYPQLSKQIAAIISIAGVAHGSPMADSLYEFYRQWVARLPVPGCETGSGEEVRELRRDVRQQWWQRYRTSFRVPIFSLAGAPRPERVSPLLRETYDKLAATDSLNDGQLIWYDTVAPQSYFLGFANADHLGIAISLSEQIPALSFLFRDDVPRTALVRGAIDLVATTLTGSGRTQNASRLGAAVKRSEG